MADLQQTTPADPNAGWEDVPNAAAPKGSPTTDDGWEDVPAEEVHPVRDFIRRSTEDIGYPSLGGALGAAAGGALGALGGGVGAVPGAAVGGTLGAMAGNELKNALRDISGQESTHGIGRVVDDASAGVLGYQQVAMPALRALTKSISGEGSIMNLLPGHVTDALHSDIGNTVAKVADEAGVKITPTTNLRKVIPQVADAVQTKAEEKMKEISDVFSSMNPTRNFMRDPFGTGRMTKGTASALDMVGDYDQIPKQIEKAQSKIASLIGPQNAEKRAAAVEELKGLQTNLKVANDMLDKQGLKGAREEADRLFAQADALKQVAKAHVDSTFGYPKATTNPTKFTQKLTSLHDNGTLTTAVGEDHAQDLMDQASRAARLHGRATAVQNLAKGAGKLALKGAGLGAAAHFVE